MGRFGVNALRNSFEAGHTSGWDISLEGMNLIEGKYVPATNVEIDELTIEEIETKIGPSISIKFPTVSTYTEEIKITFVDSHTKEIAEFIKKWVSDSKLESAVSPSLSTFAKKLTITKFNKQHEKIGSDSYMVIPSGQMPFVGDQSFTLDTNTITFRVVGIA